MFYSWVNIIHEISAEWYFDTFFEILEYLVESWYCLAVDIFQGISPLDPGSTLEKVLNGLPEGKNEGNMHKLYIFWASNESKTISSRIPCAGVCVCAFCRSPSQFEIWYSVFCHRNDSTIRLAILSRSTISVSKTTVVHRIQRFALKIWTSSLSIKMNFHLNFYEKALKSCLGLFI